MALCQEGASTLWGILIVDVVFFTVRLEVGGRGVISVDHSVPDACSVKCDVEFSVGVGVGDKHCNLDRSCHKVSN